MAVVGKAKTRPKEKARILKQEYFLVCEYCFWCASSYIVNDNYNFTSKCPNCKQEKVQSLPISSYKIKFD